MSDPRSVDSVRKSGWSQCWSIEPSTPREGTRATRERAVTSRLWAGSPDPTLCVSTDWRRGDSAHGEYLLTRWRPWSAAGKYRTPWCRAVQAAESCQRTHEWPVTASESIFERQTMTCRASKVFHRPETCGVHGAKTTHRRLHGAGKGLSRVSGRQTGPARARQTPIATKHRRRSSQASGILAPRSDGGGCVTQPNG